MTDPETKKINRREFLWSLGFFSFTAVFDISPAIRQLLLPQEICVTSPLCFAALDGCYGVKGFYTEDAPIHSCFAGVGDNDLRLAREISHSVHRLSAKPIPANSEDFQKSGLW